MADWSAVVPVPEGTPAPVLPAGFAGTPYPSLGAALAGYVCRNGAGKAYPLAWCQNGSPDAREWRWQAIPGLPDPQGWLDAKAAPAPAVEARREPEDAAAGDPGPQPDATPTSDGPDWPFTCLGHDHGTYYYMGHGTKQLTALRASQHTPLNLNMLAPLSFWVRNWNTKKGYDSDQAAADLMTYQHNVGVYSANRIRGRGAWWDNDSERAVVHLGDRLIIGGQDCGLNDHGTKYIYESASTLPTAAPLRPAQSVKLIEICESISWDKPVNGRLLAGWIVCANICGALRWKPNIWLLGPKESGKSTVIEKIVFRALGENALYALGGTTEASLRGLLRADAMPVIIDDMDSSTARARENNQAIFGLMRIFSGEGGGAQHKASQTGGAVNSYKIHSCYIYSGVTMEADKGADVSRIAVLSMRPRQFSPDQYENLLALIGSILTPEFAPALFARCINMIPTIRKNAETFAQAIALQTGSRRSGDVNGHLFAGAYSLFSDKLISSEAAIAYVGTREDVMALIREEKQTVTENNDGHKCLAHLMEQVVTDTVDGRMFRASVYELLRASESEDFDRARTAVFLLRRNGIIVNHKGDNAHFYVANDHSALKSLFRDSPWPSGWAGMLRTIAGAQPVDTMSFATRKSRATRLPMPTDALEPSPPPDEELLI